MLRVQCSELALYNFQPTFETLVMKMDSVKEFDCKTDVSTSTAVEYKVLVLTEQFGFFPYKTTRWITHAIAIDSYGGTMTDSLNIDVLKCFFLRK